MPPGAARRNIVIRIESISSGNPLFPPLPPNTLSRVFRFAPEGTRFLTPITLIISYHESEVDGLDENTFVPILLVGNGWVMVKACQSDDPLIPDPCLANRDAINNKLTIKTTHFSIYGVQGALALTPPPVITPTEVGAGLELLGENMVRVWHLDDASETWSFFDPRRDFAELGELTELVSGETYWIKLNQDQAATLNGEARSLKAGWNTIFW